MAENDEVLITTWEMTRDLPPLPDGGFAISIEGVTVWADSGVPVDWDELVRLGYYEKRKQCPACGGTGLLSKE